MRQTVLLAALLSLAASYRVTPETLRAVYDLAREGDELTLVAGAYGELGIARPGITIRGPLIGEAAFTKVVLLQGARGTTLDKLTVTGQGVLVIAADRVVLRRLKIVDNQWHGIALWCHPHAETCEDPPDDVTIEDCRIERNALDAVRIEGGNRLNFRRNKVRHNLLHGWFDKQENRHAVVEYNEFAYNGQAGVRNKGNGAWRGTPGDPYIVQFNLATKNGSGGFLMDGDAGEASPGDDGEPKYVRFRNNDSYDNGDAGMIR